MRPLPTDGRTWCFPKSEPVPIPTLNVRDQARALKHALVMIEKHPHDTANTVYCRAADALYEALRAKVGDFEPEIPVVDRIRVKAEKGAFA